MAGLTRCGFPLPTYGLADEKYSHRRADNVSLLTVVSGHLIWHLGDTPDKSAAAFEQFYQAFRRAAVGHNPAYVVRGMLTDGFERTHRG